VGGVVGFVDLEARRHVFFIDFRSLELKLPLMETTSLNFDSLGLRTDQWRLLHIVFLSRSFPRL